MDDNLIGHMDRNNEINNLINAAAAASGEGYAEGDMSLDHANVESHDIHKPGFWRPVVLQPEDVHAIQEAAKVVCESRTDRAFQPEPYSRKQGSEVAYQEMNDLMDFRGESDHPERVELMRKHSMIFRPSGPNSRALTLYEQAVNEASAQIAFHFPAAIYHKRDLAILAKQAVRMTGFEFPNARSGYYPPGSIVPGKSFMEDGTEVGEYQVSTPSQPASAAPSASVLLQKSGVLGGKRSSVNNTLSPDESDIIMQTVREMSPEIPQFNLKTREQCSLIENYVYTDATRISKISPDNLDDEMDYIREISMVYGRYPSGPRNPNAKLSPYELGINEAAAWLVRLQPALLTHANQLAELARRVVAASGLHLKSGIGTSQSLSSHSYPQHIHDKWSSRGTGGKFGFSGTTMGSSGDVVQIRLQGDTYSGTGPLGSSGGDIFNALNNFGSITSSGVPYYIDSIGAGVGLGAGMLAFEDDLGYSGLEENELVQLLGGSQAIAQLSDSQLEELGRTQFTIVDSRTDNEMANCPLSLVVEEDDRPLDEAEILRVSRSKCLERVKILSVPACGYTSINATHLARCVHLRELDLSENALRVFPRRLHLPQLKKLSITGNRFIHLPLVEQFPKLVRLNLDDKLKQLLNPQMLAYFCPRLKYINGQYFEEMHTDFTVRIIQEARAIVDPHIRSKWEADFADRYPFVKSREERMLLIENMVRHLKERNLLMDEALSKYKDLMLFRFIDEYLRSKLYDVTETDTITTAESNGEKVTNTSKFNELSEVTGSSDESPRSTFTQKKSDSSTKVSFDSDAGDLKDDDEEEKEAETRAAGERALFDAADELLGTHLPDLSALAQNTNQFQTTLFVDQLGQLHQQSLLLTPNGTCLLAPSTNAGITAASGQPTYQLHLGRSLRQGRSIVMTVVRPRGVSGRPVAEFLPGELRNKDYVKGYMASEIYKKAVKDTLGQKATPKKRSGPGRPRKSDQINSTPDRSWSGSTGSGLVPLGELNSELSAGVVNKKSVSHNQVANVRSSTGRPNKVEFDSADDSSAGTGLPPRPKKRKSMGMHRSLRDLCSDISFNSDSVITGPRSDATPIDYDPLHFIRCHAKDNDAGDSETKVWRCLFEPNPMRPEETTHVVATCGGECVCLINCETGKVMKRFKHMEEEFYTIAWTTVEVDGGKRTNILAAAGRMREIRLLHPEQLVCYAEMKGHTEDVTAMIFHQTQSTILFSGDSKASVIVWDIGVPSVPDYKTRYQLLMRLRCPRLDVNPVLNLVFLPHYAYLVAGCEDGLFAWKITDLRLEKREREPDMELKLDFDREVCIDALAQLSDNALVIKVVESGEIMVFDFASVLERRKGLQRVVPLEMRGHLLWQKTDEIYINVSVRQNLGAVLCGDNEGSIWIYDLDPYLDDLHSSSRKRFHVKPIKILEWPECSVQGNRDEDQQLKESITSGFRNPVVNSVEMSSDGYYLAAVTDNNLVCIWRYAPAQQYPQIQQSVHAHHTQLLSHNTTTTVSSLPGTTDVLNILNNSSSNMGTTNAIELVATQQLLG